MNTAGYLALAASMKPAQRTVLLSSVADQPVEITFGHPDAGSVIPGLAANPELIEFLFNETEDGEAAVTEFTIESVIGLFKRMGPHAISAIIAASMRDEEKDTSLAGNTQIEAWIRKWSPADQIKALLTIHEVTNLVDFFGLLWSLAMVLPVGQALREAMQSALASNENSSGERPHNPETSESGTALPFDPDLLMTKQTTVESNSAATETTSPSASERPAAASAAAA